MRLIVAMFFTLLLSLTAAFAVAEYQDVTYNMHGSDFLDTKMLTYITGGSLSSDTGYKKGSLYHFTDNGVNITNMQAQLKGGHTRTCRVIGDGDLVMTNSTHLLVYSHVLGYETEKYPLVSIASEISCYDFDGDGDESIILVNNEYGEIVVQVIEWDGGALSQISVNTLTDYLATNSGPIVCNNVAGSAEWRCLMQVYGAAPTQYSTLVALLKNAGVDQMYWGDNETIWANQSYYKYDQMNKPIGFQNTGTNTYRTMAYWIDRAYSIEYNTNTETMSVTNYQDMALRIGNVMPLNDYRRSASITEYSPKYFNQVAIVIRDITNDVVGIYTGPSSLSSAPVNKANITAGNCGLSPAVYNKEPVWLYDYDGDGFKDIMWFGWYSYVSGGLKMGECGGVAKLNSTMGITSSTYFSISTGAGIGVNTPEYAYENDTDTNYKPYDAQLFDYGDDGDMEVFFVSNGETAENPMIFGIDSGNLGVSVSQSINNGTIFGDVTGDNYLDMISIADNGFYIHSDASAPTMPLVVNINTTQSGCGYVNSRDQGICEFEQAQNITYQVSASKSGYGGDFYVAYDCYDDFLPPASTMIKLNSTTRFITCPYTIVGEYNTFIYVWTDSSYYNGYPMEINVTYPGGSFCDSDSICDPGETITNCAPDCSAQNATCDNDNVCEAPAENVYTCPFDCELNQCEDTIDNDADSLIDYPADPGCSSEDDDIEQDAAAYTDTLGWWKQQGHDDANTGRNTNVEDSAWFFDAGSAAKTEINVDGPAQSPSVADYDGDLENEMISVANNNIYAMSGGAAEAQATLVSLGLQSYGIDSGIETILYQEAYYMVFIQNNRTHMLSYTDGAFSLIESSDAITGGATKSGLVCDDTSLLCYAITDLNKVAEIDPVAGTVTVYATDASLYTITPDYYRQPALGDIDGVDGKELVYTVNDLASEEMKLVSFDIESSALDTDFDGDGVVESACDSDDFLSDDDIAGIATAPLLIDITGNSNDDIVFGCAAYEYNAPQYLARSWMEVYDGEGSQEFVDAVLDNNNGIDKYDIYMNHTAVIANRAVMITQPVKLKLSSGKYGTCMRAYHFAGSLERGDWACYAKATGGTATDKIDGEVCGNVDNDNLIPTCNYADDMTSACPTGACALVIDAASSNLYSYGDAADDTDEWLMFSGVYKVGDGFGSSEIAATSNSADRSYVLVADVNSDGPNDLIITQYGLRHDIWSSSYDNVPPTLNNSIENGGYLGYYKNSPICNGSTITLTAAETGPNRNYENDANGDQERLLTNCGTGNDPSADLHYGDWSSENPSVTCTFTTPGTYNVVVYIEDDKNTGDRTQRNTAAISMTVISGITGTTCNIASTLVNEIGDIGTDTTTPTEQSQSSQIDGIINLMTGANATIKFILGILVILSVAIWAGKSAGPVMGIVAALLAFIAVVFLSLISVWILIIFLMGCLLIFAFMRMINVNRGSGGD